VTKHILGLAGLSALCLAVASCSPLTPTPAAVGGQPPAAVAPAEPEAGAPVPPSRWVMARTNEIPTTARCYTLSTERVIFKVLRVTSDNRSDWDKAAEAVPETCDNGSALWDDKWYNYNMPDDGSYNLMLMWLNIDKREYAYVVIKNTPTVWIVTDSEGIVSTPGNGAEVRKHYTSDGKKIDIDIRNPKNASPWTSNDIWVSFGF
jgi:hypothetical protein